MAWDSHGQLKPAGDWARVPSAAFTRICPFSPVARNEDEIAAERFPDAAACDAFIGRHESTFVGHVAEGDFRAEGSSGGMVTWVAAELLRLGLIDAVVHAAPADPSRDGRFFAYRVSRSEGELRAGAKSRYYPVDLSSALREIRLTPGRYAIVGVPCFIKAVHLLRAEDSLLRERIAFTLGLFCGHMKSAHFLESIAGQLGVPLAELQSADYRRKDPSRPANWYTAHLTLKDGSARWQDWWDLVDGDWGAGFFQNRACGYCDDVVAETADIAFGDAWVEPYSSDGRGTNVVVVRSPVLRDMIDGAVADERLRLDPVDAAFVVQTQAAGFRQRRDGLSYRLRIMPPPLMPRKRTAPGGAALPLRRRYGSIG
jgi:coenzyme F420-reducing hydrogenase beta subunit